MWRSLRISRSDARRVALGTHSLTLVPVGPFAAGTVLPSHTVGRLEADGHGAALGSFGCALEARWRARWAPSPPPFSLLLGAMPSRSEHPQVQARLDAVAAANARLGEAPNDAARRALVRAVFRAWRSMFEVALVRPEEAYSGQVVRCVDTVFDPRIGVGQCGLPRAWWKTLLGRRLHDDLVARGGARTLWTAVDWIARDDPRVHRALERLAHAHPVVVLRERPVTTAALRTLRVTLVEGAAMQLHPCHARWATDVEDQAALWLLVPSQPEVRARLERHVDDDPPPDAAPWRGSLCIDDFLEAPSKAAVLADTWSRLAMVQEQYVEGFITEGERYNKGVDLWSAATETLVHEVLVRLEAAHEHPLAQMPQPRRAALAAMASMEGLTAKPWGELYERPIVESLREGLSPHSYFLQAQTRTAVRIRTSRRAERGAALLRACSRGWAPTRDPICSGGSWPSRRSRVRASSWPRRARPSMRGGSMPSKRRGFRGWCCVRR